MLSFFLTSVAHAQTAAPGQAPGWMNIMPIVLMFAVLYFFMLRPQMKRQRQHQDFLTKLKKGDLVLTSSGILGTIEGITDLYITLEVAAGVRIKILKAQVLGPANTEVKA